MRTKKLFAHSHITTAVNLALQPHSKWNTSIALYAVLICLLAAIIWGHVGYYGPLAIPIWYVLPLKMEDSINKQ